MKIKHWDKKLKKWVISGASDASGIGLTNPSFVDEQGIPITVDEGFTKIAQNLSRIEDNLAWIYLNGAHGGGGGTGPGIGESITIELSEDTIYTSSGNVEFSMLINSGSIARNFSIEVKDLNTGESLLKTSGRSLQYLDISLSNIQESTIVEISAMDSSYNQAIPARLPIIIGAIDISISETPKRTIDLNSLYQFDLTFYINNEISGARSDFIIEVNGEEKERVEGLAGDSPSLTYSMKQFLTDENNGFITTPGSKFRFRVYAKTMLDGVEITSNVIEYEITVVDSTNLNIVTSDIGITPETATEFVQGTDIRFGYYLSYSPTRYSLFNVEYKVYLVKPEGESFIREGQTTAEKGVNHLIFIGTIEQSPTSKDEYLRVDLEAWAISGEFDEAARDTTSVYATLSENLDKDLTVNNDNNGLLAYYSGMRWLPLANDTVWNYKWSDDPDSLFYYNHSTFFKPLEDGVNLRLNKTNGNTTGFINAGTVLNPVNGIVLNGESSANIELKNVMFPDTSEFSNSFFQPTGFNFSMTYKAKAMPDTTRTVFSIGRYKNDRLVSGIEVNLDTARLAIEHRTDIEVKLPLNELITLDFDVSRTDVGWYFKIYLNGVLSAVTVEDSEDRINWTFNEDLYFGCRNNAGVLSHFADVSFYDIKVYTKSQPEVSIVQNYISATEQSQLKGGKVDVDLDRKLRAQNFFDADGKCVIWDYNKLGGPGFKEGRDLYETLTGQIGDENRTVRTPYPVIFVQETSAVPTDFKRFSTAVYPESDKAAIMDRQFNCVVNYISEEGREIIRTPQGTPEDQGVRIGLQGTSSLSYSSKNYELYMGEMPDGRNQLFTPRDDWLPENQFTLKADVMDSAHVNNVVIGKIINGEVEDDQGNSIRPMDLTPPMKLSNSHFVGEDGTTKQAEEIKSKMKLTSDGFPCLLFIEYAPEVGESRGEVEFLGIYNFNLGRSAVHNLGLELLQSYETVDNKPAPAVIESYKSNRTFWNTDQSGAIDWEGGKTGGAYSMEFLQNNSTYGALSQGDMSIVRSMVDPIYSSWAASNLPYRAAQEFFEQMAKRVKKGEVYEPLRIDDNGVVRLKENTPNYVYTEADYTFIETRKFLHWESAVNYYLLVLIFGMVDSVVKNLTIRSWGEEWYPAFYDMDTAFGIDNAGQDTVEYWAHLHYWRNVTAEDGLTTYTHDKFYPHDNNRGLEQHFAAYWNRLWEIVETLPGYDSDVTDTTQTMETRYAALRTSLFKDPEKFIEDHYQSYTDSTGAIVFNYDYKIKYLQLMQSFNEDTQEYEDLTDFSQLAFLHGNRVVHVKDWFKKRIYFLDSVYGLDASGNAVFPHSVAYSPINTSWVDNRATGSSSDNQLVTVEMQAPSKMIFQWKHGDNITGSFMVDENDTEAVISQIGGFNVVTFYANKFITKFKNFKDFNWSVLRNVDFPSLLELDLSNLINVNIDKNFFDGEVANIATNTGLVSIEKLNLSGVKFRKEDSHRSFTLRLQNCHYLNHLDISNSDITDYELPTTGSLKYLDLSNTRIPTLKLENQSFLEVLRIDNCLNLTEVELVNCNSLQNIDLPPNVETLKIINCPLLDEINIPFHSSGSRISNLKYIDVENCEGLRTFNISGQNNNQLEVNLNGAPNLEHIDFSYTNTDNILLPNLQGENGFVSLRSLNISNSDIKSLKYNDDIETETDYGRLNLTNFPNLENIQAAYNTSLEYVDCVNNPEHTIELRSSAFNDCGRLRELTGHFTLNGYDIFKNCHNFILNDPELYLTTTPDMFIEGPKAANFKINSYSLKGVFEGCSSLTYDDFRRIQYQFNDNINSLEDAFKGCYEIKGDISRDFFTRARGVTNLKGAFEGTGLSGSIVSRSDNFTLDDETTWGTFDYLPNLINAESAFSNTNINWIDNNLFKSVGDYKYKIRNINNLFRNCYNLKSAENTRVQLIEPGYLNSKTFFNDLEYLSDAYPKNVFEGTLDVRMNVINEKIDGVDHTFLFHLNSRKSHPSLDDSLYKGVKLYGEIKENVFGGIQNELIDGKYYIPTFRSIIKPFTNNGDNLKIDLGNTSKIFHNLSATLLRADYVFSGLNFLNDNFVPDDILKGCYNLISIEGLFSNIDVTNKNRIYKFPNSTIFKDTLKLENIQNLFQGTNKMKIELQGEGFKNCKLKDVSRAFASSGVFGYIPYRLFFMEHNGILNRTIEKMDNIFNSCWLLGYNEDREISIGEVIESYEDEYGVHTRYTTWQDNIVAVEGELKQFKLEDTVLKKVYNYSKDDRKTILNPEYEENLIPNPDFDPEIPNSPEYILDPEAGDIPETIDNPKYDPGDYHYDSWYLDGYTWDGKTSEQPDDPEFISQRNRLEEKYFKYDRKQMESINNANSTIDLIIETPQNYIVPTDLFRYCSTSCNLSNVFSDLNWFERVITQDTTTGRGSVEINEKTLQGLRGRIPARLLEDLVDHTTIEGLFRDSIVDPYYNVRGLNASEIKRGLMYPEDLFKYNKELRNLPDLFNGTSIPSGIDINKNLFSNLEALGNISNMWANATFSDALFAYPDKNSPSDFEYPQIPYSDIFANNTRITDASGLFAVYNIRDTSKGLHSVDKSLLRNSRSITNVSNMFYYNTLIDGTVPEFRSSIYQRLSSVDGYLVGVNESQIANSGTINPVLRPMVWDQ